MSLVETIRRTHPLHRLRRWQLFQTISRHFDPIVPWRLAIFSHPVYLRPLAHGALMLGAVGQDRSTYQTFVSILRALPVGSFWDIGANIGHFSWLCATTRPDFEIVSFEPDRKNLVCLERTSKRWNLRKHTIIPRAVAERSGRAAFFVDTLSGATGTLEGSCQTFNTLHYAVQADRSEVETISLDEFLNENGGTAPVAIKIDVEGAEMRVLQGASKTIAQHQPVLLFESFEHGEEIVARLAAHGYQCLDSDRRQDMTDATLNFVGLVPERWPEVASALKSLGYPV